MVGFGLDKEIVGGVVMQFLHNVSRPHPFKVKPGYMTGGTDFKRGGLS